MKISALKCQQTIVIFQLQDSCTWKSNHSTQVDVRNLPAIKSSCSHCLINYNVQRMNHHETSNKLVRSTSRVTGYVRHSTTLIVLTTRHSDTDTL